jgi:parallel beta-helix repeat protein
MDSASENFFTTNSIDNNGAGVEMHDSHQNTFINFNIANCTFGFIIFHGSNNNIMNSIFDNNGAAINLQTCTYTNVDNNQMNNNSYGVYLFEGDHNIVQGLQVTDIKLDGSGVFLDGSEQNTVKKNSFINSEKFSLMEYTRLVVVAMSWNPILLYVTIQV